MQTIVTVLASSAICHSRPHFTIRASRFHSHFRPYVHSRDHQQGCDMSRHGRRVLGCRQSCIQVLLPVLLLVLVLYMHYLGFVVAV